MRRIVSAWNAKKKLYYAADSIRLEYEEKALDAADKIRLEYEEK